MTSQPVPEAPGARVFIAGGTGFLGQHLARAWVERGATVVLSSRRDAKDVPAQEGIEVVRWDPATEPAPVAEIARCAVVYNLIGENIGAQRWSRSKKLQLRRSRLESTNKIVAALSKRNQVFLNASAVSAYPGDGRRYGDDVPIPLPDTPSFIHQMTRDWEAAALAADGMTRVVLLRIGVVLGDGGMLEGILPLFRLRVGRHLGWAESRVPWIDLRDVVRMLVFLANDPAARGAFDVVAPDPVPFSRFSAVLQEEIGARSFAGLPAWLVRLALGSDASELVLARYDVRPSRALSIGFHFAHTDLRISLRSAVEALAARSARR